MVKIMMTCVAQIMFSIIMLFFSECYGYPVGVCSADAFEQLNWCNQEYGSSFANICCQRINASYTGHCEQALVALTDVNNMTGYVWKTIAICKFGAEYHDCISTNPDPRERNGLLLWTYNSAARTCAPRETIDHFFGGGGGGGGDGKDGGDSSKDDSSGAGGSSSGEGKSKSKKTSKGGRVRKFISNLLTP